MIHPVSPGTGSGKRPACGADAAMADASFHLAPAAPAHVETAAALIYATGPRVFDFVYGNQAVAEDVVVFCFGKRWNPYSYRYATAAVADGRMVGLELGFDAHQKRRLDQMNVPYHLWRLPPRRWRGLFTASQALGPCFPPPAPGEYYVQNLAVASERRSCGIGERLLQTAFDRAAARGYAACTLDVALTNAGGIRFYERMGMTVQQELPPPDIDPRHAVPGHLRMVKRLA